MRRYRVSQRVNQVKNDDLNARRRLTLQLVKVVRANLGFTDLQRANRARLYGDHVLLILQLAFNQQKLFVDHHRLNCS